MLTRVIIGKLIRRARDFFRDNEGVTAIEYALLALLIAMGIVVGVTLVGTGVSILYDGIGTGLQDVSP
jgi:pilus assembly protein Flp/PilA